MITLTKDQEAQLKKQGLAASKNNLQANQSFQSLWAPDHATKATWLCQLKVGAKGGLAVLMVTSNGDSYKVATASGFYALLEEHYEMNSDVLVNDSYIEIEACYRAPRPMPTEVDTVAYKTFQAGLERLVTTYGTNGQSHIDEWQAALDNPEGASQQLLGLTIVDSEA